MAIEKIELSDAIQSLATQSTVDSLVGSLSGEAVNIGAANLATVVAEGLASSADKTIFRRRNTYIKTDEDYDNIDSNGIYIISSYTSEAGYPTNGLLLSFVMQSQRWQLFTDSNGSTLKMRVYWYTYWRAWRTFALA